MKIPHTILALALVSAAGSGAAAQDALRGPEAIRYLGGNTLQMPGPGEFLYVAADGGARHLIGQSKTSLRWVFEAEKFCISDPATPDTPQRCFTVEATPAKAHFGGDRGEFDADILPGNSKNL